MTKKQECWFTFLITMILFNVTDGLISLGYAILSCILLLLWLTEEL